MYLYLEIWSWTSWSCLQVVQNYFFLYTSHLNLISSVYTNFHENPITIRTFFLFFLFFYLLFWSWTSWSCLQVVQNHFFLDIRELDLVRSIPTNFHENRITTSIFLSLFTVTCNKSPPPLKN